MHARSASSRKFVALPPVTSVCIHLDFRTLNQFPNCFCSRTRITLNHLQVGGLSATRGGCRPLVGHLRRLQATFFGRSANCFCILQFCCKQSTKRARQGICRVCAYNHSPYHFSNSKECDTRLLSHQPSIAMHDGQEVEFVQVHEYTSNTQDSRGLHHIMHNKGGQRLRNKARFITSSMTCPKQWPK